MAELLSAVNSQMKTEYNSILVNKYKDLHCSLGFHKDDETSIDPSSPISALSLGATRRLNISLNGDKYVVKHSYRLESQSMFTMLPGFQDAFYHSIAPGRKSIKKERGVRISVTFRRILPEPGSTQQNDTTAYPPPATESREEEEEEKKKQILDKDEKQTYHPDTIVFGSSLAKSLDATLLSRYSKTFKVYSNSGARVKDIEDDVKKMKEDQHLDTTKVSSVFLLCGGNDVGQLRQDSDIINIYDDYTSLVAFTQIVFPNAKINVISLIPRIARYKSHIQNMHIMNEWLEIFCTKNSHRYVDIFTHFLVTLPRPHIWHIDGKLFRHDRVHFSDVGNSVIAKVLIAVANTPWKK